MNTEDDYMLNHIELFDTLNTDPIWNLETTDIIKTCIIKRIQDRYIIKCPYCFFGQFTMSKKPFSFMGEALICRYIKCQKIYTI